VVVEADHADSFLTTLCGVLHARLSKGLILDRSHQNAHEFVAAAITLFVVNFGAGKPRARRRTHAVSGSLAVLVQPI
jgi:hypothetical protein